MEKTDKYIGKMLDNRYEILEVIGVGGMAYVYKARCHLLNRLVAVKILKEDYASDADFRRRFHAESQAVAMLSHPNIVAVYDVSRSRDLEYIVMELVDGITLKQYMSKKGVLTWREGLHFVTQIVKALSHAHTKGIIHRDIKPHNIMILRDGSVKVADFGIARFASKQNTLTQEALGSVHYISPEQARGSHIDTRSDLYSVGVVLYEMLTGRLPFEGDSAVSVAIQHINSLPLAPREINPEIPGALEIITIKAMAPQLQKRYASAEEMLRDLEEFRKNPAIVFNYNIHELQTTADRENESGEDAGRPAAFAGKGREASGRKRLRGEDPEQDYKTRKSNNLIAILLVVFFVLIIVAALGFFIESIARDLFAPEDVQKIAVPNLRGMTYSDELRDKYPQFEIVPQWEHRDQYEEGYIYDQNPKFGVDIPENSKLTLFVSMGLESFIMQDYTNQEALVVRLGLEGLGLKLGKIERVEHPDIPLDRIISTDPGAGASVSKGQTVNLQVSLGPEAEKVDMPGLVGRSIQEARDILAHWNLTLGNETPAESEQEAGTVIWQSEQEGAEVAEYTVIHVRISEGPPESDVTDEPDPPDNEPITVKPTFNVPEKYWENGFTLRIEVDGDEVINEEIRAGAKTVKKTLTGLPSAGVAVYYNNTLITSTTLKDLQ